MEATLHKGDVKTADFTAAADQSAGDILGTDAGIAQVVACDTADGEIGTVYIDGIFKVNKEAGGGVTFSRGETVEWDDTAKEAVGIDGDFALGVATEAAVDGDDHVKVWINHVPQPAATST
jgi:predicted RecA/RadA family phage recombinase